MCDELEARETLNSMFLCLFYVDEGLHAHKMRNSVFVEAREMLNSVFLMLVNVSGGLCARYIQKAMFVCLFNVCDGLGALDIARST